ncbi:holo-ACP synthase [Nocardioides aequoreus]|uniref:holo-ACP synthase AcpS n=1 Tax=Nocardioides aequoreus TaxID=397278 RepID=UPI000A7B1092|nr:holo-ACP synthase [Nocardioides aequoreus]
MTDDRIPGEATNPSPPRDRVVEEVAQQPSRDAPTLDLEGAVGIGVDLVAITAFAEQLEEPGTRFARVFTPGERRTAGDDPQRLAARWAAKEAVIKAWSSTYAGRPDAIDRDHVDLREIEVRTDAWGRPSIRLHGEIARGMAGYTVLVSLTHDPAADTAAAFVVLQKT